MSISSSRRVVSAVGRRFLGFSLAVFVVGCSGGVSGPPRAPVHGSVSFDGAPVEEGAIVFLPATGTTGPSSGGVIRNGTYAIKKEDGPVPGKYRVEIRASRTTGSSTVKGAAGATEGPSAGGEVVDVKMYIPIQYNTQSTLVADIKGDDNVQDFLLKSK